MRPRPTCARWAVFSDQLHFHHVAEDQAMWPAVRAKVSADPDALALLGAMEDEHRLIDPLLAATGDAFGRNAGRSEISAMLSRVQTTLNSHLAHEEAEALPMISRAMTASEIGGIFKALGRVGGLREGLRRGAVMFPWALSGTNASTQARVLGQLPPPARLLYRARWLPRYRRRFPSL